MEQSSTTFGRGRIVQGSTDDGTQLLHNAGGTALWSLRIPNDSALERLDFYLQGFAVDPGANLAGLITSNAIDAGIAAPVRLSIVERFADEQKLDREVSGGVIVGFQIIAHTRQIAGWMHVTKGCRTGQRGQDTGVNGGLKTCFSKLLIEDGELAWPSSSTDQFN